MSAPKNDRLRILIQGGIEMTVPNDLKLISPYVLLEQEDWFEGEAPFVRKLFQPGENALDIGANYGVYSLIAAHAIGRDGRVWSFEPASSTAAFLSESLARNGFGNAKVEQYALSDREGTTELTLTGQAELNTLHAARGGNTETVRLRALDDWAQENGWPDIAFVKLDAEGEEPNVIRGGAQLFDRRSPLIMYEIRHGDKINLGLKDQFEAIGYKSYYLVPGLNLLAPFQADQPVDGFQLNLFCCKPDRARNLAARGLLDEGASGAPPQVLQGRWKADLLRRKYAASYMAAWAAKLPDVDNLARALDVYCHAQNDTLSAGQRIAALRYCHGLLGRMTAGQPPFAYLSLYARVSAELGQRAIAVHTLRRMAPMVQNRQADDSLPFLPPLARFDNISPGDKFADWAIAATLEALDKLSAYSSFYSRSSGVLLEEICKTGFQSPESERRRQLLRLRGGEQKTPEPVGPLGQPGIENLNVWYWRSGRTAGDKPQRLYDLIPNLPTINVVDIGAMMIDARDPHPYGQLVTSGRARAVGFEPNEAECAKLNQMGGQRRYYPYFIGDGGVATYYQTNNTATGSLYKPNTALMEKFNELPEYVVLKQEHPNIRTRRLDDLRHLEGLDDVDYVKIDVQGAELDVFKGAPRVLASATIIQTEVEFVPIYEGQPLFGDIDVHLRSQGYQFHTFDGLATRCFRPFRIPGQIRGMRQVLWTDATYVRDFLRLDLVSTPKLLKMAVMLDAIFKSYDLAAMVMAEVDRRLGSAFAADYARLLIPERGAAA